MPLERLSTAASASSQPPSTISTARRDRSKLGHRRSGRLRGGTLSRSLCCGTPLRCSSTSTARPSSPRCCTSSPARDACPWRSGISTSSAKPSSPKSANGSSHAPWLPSPRSNRRSGPTGPPKAIGLRSRPLARNTGGALGALTVCTGLGLAEPPLPGAMRLATPPVPTGIRPGPPVCPSTRPKPL